MCNDHVEDFPGVEYCDCCGRPVADCGCNDLGVPCGCKDPKSCEGDEEGDKK